MIYVNDIRVRAENGTEGIINLAIKFYHVTKGNDKNRGRLTRCEILVYPAGQPLTQDNFVILGVGETKVFSGNWFQQPDRFDRRVGRRESLIRALENANLNRDEKAVIWEAYRSKCKMPEQVKLPVNQLV